MNSIASHGCVSAVIQKSSISRTARDFQNQFRCSVRHCVRKGFSIEECFGLVWEETLEKVRLDEEEQAEVYAALIQWAKQEAGGMPQFGKTDPAIEPKRWNPPWA